MAKIVTLNVSLLLKSGKRPWQAVASTETTSSYE